jgi:hypothetical protein
MTLSRRKSFMGSAMEAKGRCHGAHLLLADNFFVAENMLQMGEPYEQH